MCKKETETETDKKKETDRGEEIGRERKEQISGKGYNRKERYKMKQEKVLIGQNKEKNSSLWPSGILIGG
jgi:hypothetical protein